MTDPAIPVPRVERTADSADFYDFAARGELLLRRCDHCGTVRGPQAALCPRCHLPGHTPFAAAGSGTLVSWSTVHRSPVPAVPAPYIASIVEVDEGPWVLTRLLTPGTDPETAAAGLTAGVPVEIVAVPGTDDGEHVVLARLSSAPA